MPLDLGTISTVLKVVIPVAKPLIAKVNSVFNPSDFEKALKAGIIAAHEWDEQQPYEQKLFFYCDDKQQRDVLTAFFQKTSVLEELQKPLREKTSPNLDLLIEIWEGIEKENNRWKFPPKSINNWLKKFIDTYFAKTTAYLNIKIAKVNYLQQISYYFDDVKFAGIGVEGQETDKTGIKLPQIFVMPDVVEISSTRLRRDLVFVEEASRSQDINQRQTELIQEQRQLIKLEEGGLRKFSAQELLTKSKSHKFVLLGAPGSGKTTLMSYFAVMLAQSKLQWEEDFETEENLLPILIRIRDLARHADNLSILEFIRQFAISNLQVKQPPPPGFFEYWLEDGKALILLDGLDEVANPGKRYEIVNRIECFLEQFPSNKTIITSRPAGYRQDFFHTDEFPHYQLQLFDERKIKEFTQKWYQSRFQDPTEATRRQESLQKALAEQKRIQELARNPLLLTIIALIHRYEAHLPRQRYKLYDRAVNTLLTNWDADKDLNYQLPFEYLNRDDIPRLMEQLAYWIQTQGGTADTEGGTLIDKDQLISQLSKFIAKQKRLEQYRAKSEAQRFVEHIRERTGLLNEQGQDCYAFVHKTFQEYLAAEDIRYRQEDEEFEVVLEHIENYLCDSHWREVLLLLIAQQKPRKAAKAIKHILEQPVPHDQWLHQKLFFASSCLAEDLEVADDALVTDILQQLVNLEISGDEQVGRKIRAQVFKSLRSLNEGKFEAEALQLLKDSEEQMEKVRFQEYRAALGEKEEAVETLWVLFVDDYSDVCQSAAIALGKLSNEVPEVVSILLAALKCEDSGLLREYAAIALGELGDGAPHVVEPLLAQLDDEDPDVRRRVVNALGNLGNRSPEVVSALLARLRDEHSIVRMYAANALGNLGNSSPEVISALLTQLGDGNPSVRVYAAIALGWLGNGSPQIVEQLLARLGDEYCDVRIGTAIALSHLGYGTPQIIKQLLAGLKDEHSVVRMYVAYFLGNLANEVPQILELMLARLEDKNFSVRVGAAIGLGNSGNGAPQIVQPLLTRLGDEHFSVRESAADALANLGKNCNYIKPAVIEWIFQHQDTEYVGNGIDALWMLVGTDNINSV
ncbi:HEAT repeat domain-containing protein [Mastigocoleus testarum]|uniref:Signal transduction protein n=1 Tax=Mastigocoleus testarum BC008 TaxID=371196 RepID=A0A0V7ZMU4_9CYAN|nr:HEAT repeat domain-containing protein [Mastigocoleus testarum]KST65567.1 signal transduction protein [Mastigocoleus testarum BC008]KST66044.1 signal transduction protein [Mastigocoleus testarum BC008]